MNGNLDSASWALSWDAAREFGEVDPQFVEVGQACSRVGSACLGVLLLVLGQFAGSFGETMVAVGAVQRQGVDHGVGGHADLADGDLRIFPPGAAGSGGPGTSG